MEIGLKIALSNTSEKRLRVHCGRQEKAYHRCTITSSTIQASAQPPLLTPSPEHPFSPSLPGAPPGSSPAPRGAGEFRAARAQPRQGPGALGTKGRMGHEALPVWFFWVTCKVCPRKHHPGRDGADSKVCRRARVSDSFNSTIFTSHLSFFTT